MTLKTIITLLLSFLLAPLFAQTHKEELTARIKAYYIVEASSYPTTQAHVNALEPFIVPTKEGHKYAEYVAETAESNYNKYNGIKQFSVRTRIVSISAGDNDKVALVVSEDIFLYDGNPYSTTTSTAEWVYQKKQWYRSAKKSVEQHR